MRGHIRSIELADGPSPSALVHDFHVYEIVPSVAFAAKVPDSPKDSLLWKSLYWSQILSLLQHRLVTTSLPFYVTGS